MEPNPEPEQLGENIYLASVYRLHAVNFRLSAETLSHTMEVKSDGSPAKLTAIPFYFLISHATELLLKSALLKRGFGEADLKKFDYRHNLSGLLGALRDKAVFITADTIRLIDGLHAQHLNHALRYSVLVDNGQKTFLPPPPILFAMLDELLLLTRVGEKEP
jgi:hypothetical protein